MNIRFEKTSGEFHLYNDHVSCILQILDNGHIANLYLGKVIRHKADFSHMLYGGHRPLAVYTRENDYTLSLQYTKLEYPCYGTGDFRYPAIMVLQKNGSRITNLVYQSHAIFDGKKPLPGLPATYTEMKEEAKTLEICLFDPLIQLKCILSYTIFDAYAVIAKSVRLENCGEDEIVLERAFSACIDLPDSDYDMMQFSGAWARERHLKTRRLEQGIQGIYSMRGISSAEHNPFLILKRPHTDEDAGEAFGIVLIYSGNFLMQAEVDTNGMTRLLTGIHPDTFAWPLRPGEFFQTPETLLAYSHNGLNALSHTLHGLMRTRLVRGAWRDAVRPVLINNWEATGAAFTQDAILQIAKTAKDLGVELFVLDDGWFGGRDNDRRGLGDWYVTDRKKLPDGITGLAEKVNRLGMKFGLWIEPEMVNRDSDLYRAHPDWILCTPGRTPSPSRNQYVLDYSRAEVVDYIFSLLQQLLGDADIAYVKWDMNRYLTECFSFTKSAGEQGKVFHQYILGVYSLYERLIQHFPHVLFESCSSGGARFDAGMLYYAPQAWTSDNTDAVERLKIQYGTSYAYPIVSMGAHVSAVPNHQVGRTTPLETRGNVALFGAFGYELDFNQLTQSEREIIRQQICFQKKHAQLLQYGDFYRLQSPFQGQTAAWMVVSPNRSQAIVGFYKLLNSSNGPWHTLRLKGLKADAPYMVNSNASILYYGDELMNVGLFIDPKTLCAESSDFSSCLYTITQMENTGITI